LSKNSCTVTFKGDPSKAGTISYQPLLVKNGELGLAVLQMASRLRSIEKTSTFPAKPVAINGR
jgi:hypothetical protein